MILDGKTLSTLTRRWRTADSSPAPTESLGFKGGGERRDGRYSRDAMERQLPACPTCGEPACMPCRSPGKNTRKVRAPHRRRECLVLGIPINSFKRLHQESDNPHTGKRASPEYTAWKGMRDRCSRVTSSKFALYGGRGITVCDRWRDSFENFLADIGRRPSPRHSVDRINVDGNYEPSNCRWATQAEQCQNTRNNKLSKEDVINIRKELAGGRSQASLAKAYGVTPQTVHAIKSRETWKNV